MKILIASSEAVPYVKTGGLGDVAGALLKELRLLKEDARIVLPLYRTIREGYKKLTDTGKMLNVSVGDTIIKGKVLSDKQVAYFIECDEFFDRPEIYGTPNGDYADNSSRFVFFSRAILEMCKALNYRPDIIHCNDWQTGLTPLYLNTLFRKDSHFRDLATLLSIHNLGYQGLFPASHMPLTNLGWEMFTPEGIEFYGKVNFLKAGLIAADVLSTVSETYSREILSPDFGFGLHGVLKKRESDLYGILNGIDYGDWDPQNDNFLPAHYHSDDLSGKDICKRELLKVLFPKTIESDIRVPLVGMVTRFSEQKGIDLVLQAIPDILSAGVRLVILGKGDERFQKSFREVAGKRDDFISVTIGFNEALAHRIYAGSDFFLMPSKYEPCGLGQLIAMRYGTIPIVRKTGGLADTVQEYDPLSVKGTGFLFSDYTVHSLIDSLKRALFVYADREKMQMMIRNGMNMDFSWKRSAQRYLELYRIAIRKKSG